MHPFAHNKSHKAASRRVAHILKSGGIAGAMPRKARGGSAGKHHDMRGGFQAEEKAELHSEGHRGRHRFKAGGKVKPRHQTNIAIVLPHHGPQVGAGPATPPPGAMGPGPGLMPPGAAPGALPMRARGGHVLPDNSRNDISSYRPAHAQGGSVKAGASSGVSRKEIYDKMKGRH